MKEQRLNKWTIEALQHKATTAEETVDAADPETQVWVLIASECRAAVKGGTVESLSQHKAAQVELDDYLGGDRPRAENEAIEEDLCRAGYYDRWKAGHIWTRPPVTRKVDGVRYITG